MQRFLQKEIEATDPCSQKGTGPWLFSPIQCLNMLRGTAGPQSPDDIREPSHGRVDREKFRSIYVVKGVWSVLTEIEEFYSIQYLYDYVNLER